MSNPTETVLDKTTTSGEKLVIQQNNDIVRVLVSYNSGEIQLQYVLRNEETDTSSAVQQVIESSLMGSTHDNIMVSFKYYRFDLVDASLEDGKIVPAVMRIHNYKPNQFIFLENYCDGKPAWSLEEPVSGIGLKNGNLDQIQEKGEWLKGYIPVSEEDLPKDYLQFLDQAYLLSLMDFEKTPTSKLSVLKS